jgi:DNA-binding CsgD family transcriptional regulator
VQFSANFSNLDVSVDPPKAQQMSSHHVNVGATDPNLTDREQEILRWVTLGKSDWEIAVILKISTKTVNFHVENAKRKLGTASRVAAVSVALRDGWLPFPPRLDQHV